MKKNPLVLALPAVLLGSLLLSGCGMFRSQKAWQNAKQESPLEIPPGLDTPNATAALVIPPPGGNNPTANGDVATVGSAGNAIADGFVLSDSVDNAYRRVGQALQSGELGQVTAHDDAAHSYTLAVAAATGEHKRGFFSRIWHHKQADQAAGGATRQVQITVNGSGQNASEVRAQGPAAAVAKVVDGLKSRLGS